MARPHWPSRVWLAAAAGWLGWVGCGAGCTTPKGTAQSAATGADAYKVVVASTPFYSFGPQQPHGPDRLLEKGVEVTMLHRAFGFSRVRMTDGRAGYIGTGDIAPLTAADLAADQAAARQAALLARLQQPRPRSPEGSSSPIPPAAGNEEQLPQAEPSPTPKNR